MAVTSYHTVDGQILGQTAPGARTQYLTDALGSVTCTVDDDGFTLNTYRYKPYGAQLAKTGVAADTRFLWIGSKGYGHKPTSAVPHYVRARHYSSSTGAWTTVDKLWPYQPPYCYVGQQITRFIDPTGFSSCSIECCCNLDRLELGVVERFDGPEFWGHRIQLEVTIHIRTKKPYEKRESCKLEWWEMSTDDNTELEGPPKDCWYELRQYDFFFQGLPEPAFEDFLKNLTCNGLGASFIAKDKPGIGEGAIHFRRLLCIKARVFDGCTASWEEKTFQQLIDYTHGGKTTVLPPGHSQELDDYCKGTKKCK